MMYFIQKLARPFYGPGVCEAEGNHLGPRSDADGAPNRNRTRNVRDGSAVLYQLSYQRGKV